MTKTATDDFTGPDLGGKWETYRSDQYADIRLSDIPQTIGFTLRASGACGPTYVTGASCAVCGRLWAAGDVIAAASIGGTWALKHVECG